MTTAAELLTELKDSGVQLSLTDGELEVYPLSKVTEAQIENLGQNGQVLEQLVELQEWQQALEEDTKSSWKEVGVRILEHSLITGTQERSCSETSSAMRDVSGEPRATANRPLSRVRTAALNKKNGGTKPYELAKCPGKCPKCFQENSVHRDTDHYGTYDSCRTCGWLDNVDFSRWWHIAPKVAQTLETDQGAVARASDQ